MGVTCAAENSAFLSNASPWLVAFHSKAITPPAISFHQACRACPLAATFPSCANAHGTVILSHVCRGM